MNKHNKKKWEIVVEPKSPIPIENLETIIEEGENLNFPIHRSFIYNLINQHWDMFIEDMAQRKKEDLKHAILNNNEEAFREHIRHISSINSYYRMNNAEFSANKLKLVLSLTDFREYIGTTMYSLLDKQFKELLMRLGEEDKNDPNYYFANPLAVCSNIVTSDRKVPICMRSKKVSIYPETLHVIGGFVKANYHNNF